MKDDHIACPCCKYTCTKNSNDARKCVLFLSKRYYLYLCSFLHTFSYVDDSRVYL